MTHFTFSRIAALQFGLLAPGAASASGFQLLMQNGSGLGNAYAGSAAWGEDASVNFANPAADVLLERRTQVTLFGGVIDFSTEFHDQASIPPVLQPRGGDGGDAGDVAFLPSLHFVWGAGKDWSVGISLDSPFGTKTEYEDGWIGRYQGLKSEIKTYNVNPSISYRISSVLAVGAGVNYQKIDADLTSAVNVSAGLCGLLPDLCATGLLNGLDAHSKVKGDDSAWGFNLGVIVSPDAKTRLGLAYRSAIRYGVKGDVSFEKPSVALPASVPGSAMISAAINNRLATSPELADGPIRSDIKLPASTVLSVFRQMDARWSVLADVSWTGWSCIQSLDIYRGDGSLLSTTPEKWRDTWRFALGLNYALDDRVVLRGGASYEQSPVRYAEFRTPRLPDSEISSLAVGLQYRLTQQWTIDLAYLHGFLAQAPIHNDGHDPARASTVGTLIGEYMSGVDLFGLQIAYAF
jgi:long-chain fatty acid transport protein